MSAQEISYLLGIASSLLDECRAYMIMKQDTEGLNLIEDRYQKLTKGIEQVIYRNDYKEE